MDKTKLCFRIPKTVEIQGKDNIINSIKEPGIMISVTHNFNPNKILGMATVHEDKELSNDEEYVYTFEIDSEIPKSLEEKIGTMLYFEVGGSLVVS